MFDRTKPVRPTGKLAPQPWMEAAETKAAIAALTKGGAEVRFVGGCVRDAIAHRPVKDIDIATTDRPETVVALLEAAGIRAIPTGIEHGTVTAVVGDKHFEITTLRVDVETDGRRAKVAFTDDWVADAARRDFTVNTLSCNPAGDVYDPFEGLGDLAHGHIRFVGNAVERIEEDALRMLRFFRFFATYGRPPPDRDALAACRKMAPMLDGLSAERVWSELRRILLSTDPGGILVLMRGERVLERILPEAGDVGQLRALAWLETTAVKIETVAPDPIRRLAAVIDADAAGAEACARRLRLSNRETERLRALAAPAMEVSPELDAKTRRRAFHRLGAETVRDLALLSWAMSVAVMPHQPKGRNEAWRELIEQADAWTPVELPVKGQDALDMGVPPGAAVGRLLAAVETWWEDGDYRADRAACLAKLRQAANEPN